MGLRSHLGYAEREAVLQPMCHDYIILFLVFGTYRSISDDRGAVSLDFAGFEPFKSKRFRGVF